MRTSATLGGGSAARRGGRWGTGKAMGDATPALTDLRFDCAIGRAIFENQRARRCRKSIAGRLRTFAEPGAEIYAERQFAEELPRRWQGRGTKNRRGLAGCAAGYSFHGLAIALGRSGPELEEVERCLHRGEEMFRVSYRHGCNGD